MAGPVADRVELAFRRAADAALPTDSTGIVAVSGGGDSMALLHLLARAARRRRWRLHVAHLDHGMRRGSAADARFVTAQAATLSLPVVRDRRVVGKLRRQDESPEEAARRVRRGFLLEVAEEAEATWIATGHSLDDQAETILMRLARGGGATALTGMAASGPGPFARPLLGIERAELRQWLERRGLDYRDDPTNREMRYDRNRIRRLVMPVLTETFNPRAAANLVRAALRFREDASFLDELASERSKSVCGTDRAGRVTLNAQALREEPGPVARRVAVLALQRAGCDPRRIGSRHVEALVDLAGGSGGRETHLPGGMMARRDRNRIRIGRRRELA
jgi:tRNA(Ile)-lysidine synthase